MRRPALLQQAVLNHIDWCDELAHAQGNTAAKIGDYWLCQESMPRGFPNIITQTSVPFNNAMANDMLTPLDSAAAFFDSFADSKNIHHSFDMALDACWYSYSPRLFNKKISNFEALMQVQDKQTLTAWQQAWQGEHRCEEAFPACLIDHPAIQFVYLCDRDRICCGAVLFLSQKVMSINHLFGTTEEQQRLVRTIQMTYPKETLVGYGEEEELTLLKPFGFHELGNLRLLIKH